VGATPVLQATAGQKGRLRLDPQLVTMATGATATQPMRIVPCSVLVLALAAPSAGAQASWNSGRDVGCGHFPCLTEAELASLVGKRLVYRHPRGFGDVVLELRRDGTLAARNSQASGGTGPYRFDNGLVVAQLSRWGQNRFQFVRLGRDQLAVLVAQPGTMLIPVAVTDL
jgi:hypothetical protein